MSVCQRCGVTFHCAMADPGADGQPDRQPCWCTYCPPAVPVPAKNDGAAAVGCWCPDCLRAHIASLKAPDAA